MNLRQTQIVRGLALALLAAGLGACGTSRGDRERQQYVEEPVAQLYNRGADYLDNGRYAL